MKKELTAGGVVVRKKGASWHVLLIKDMNNSWTFPKGHIEKDEKAIDAAKREIAEEVGLRDVLPLSPLTPVTYTFRRNGPVHKTVEYFLFITAGLEPFVLQRKEGIKDAAWVPLAAASARIGYPKTNKPLLTEAKAVLKKHIHP